MTAQEHAIVAISILHQQGMSVCLECDKPWPCPTVQFLRAIEHNEVVEPGK
jgi:hypothetical protein